MQSENSIGFENGGMEKEDVALCGNKEDVTLCGETPISIENEICFYCRKKATMPCQYCKGIYFCSDEHGNIHRPDDVCFPFRIEYLPHVGNYMVASRDIEPAGTI